MNKDTHQAAIGVTALSHMIKTTLEGALPRVVVRGEISGAKLYPSGHFYFKLKEGDAVIEAVIWAGVRRGLQAQPTDGMDVIIHGKLSVYAARSQYQLTVDRLELAGEGALLKMLEDRRRKLAAEGLFDEARKKPLPPMPQKIGIITSLAGAVMHDMLNRFRLRVAARIIIWPVAVQGAGAAEQIIAALDGFNAAPPAWRPDVIVLARGGGSREDLMAFNDEQLVRAIARSAVPTISAIGHETDWSFADMVADKRAPTPTGAAEILLPTTESMRIQLGQLAARLKQKFSHVLANAQQRMVYLERRLGSPARDVLARAQRLDDMGARLESAQNRFFGRLRYRLELSQVPHPYQAVKSAQTRLADWVQRLHNIRTPYFNTHATALAAMNRLLDNMSYHTILSRGFVLVRGTGDHVITSAAAARAQPTLTLNFADGAVVVKPQPD